MDNKLQAEFNEWVQEIMCADSLPEDVLAFNFNIYEEEEEYIVEVIGTASFNEADQEWVLDEIWNSGPLMFIIPMDAFDGDWEDFHDLIADLLDNLLGTPLKAASVLKNSEAVAVGFIDSDVEIIWQNI